MFSFPPIPPLEGMHPIIVHFPLGLLMLAWIPMLLCLIDKKRRSAWIQTALTMLVLGTAFTFAAVYTGEETAHIVGAQTQEIKDAIHEHEELAESARNFFIAITILFALIPIARAKLTKPKKKPAIIILSTLVAISYALGALTLANTGHQGGLLVHHHAIHAPLSAP